MPPKRAQQLQETLDNENQWQKFVDHEGLAVVDVYSAWCGQCKAVISLFRRVKNELGDDLLKFAIAKSDEISSLEEYRDRSEPTFLMYSAGILVGVLHGAQGPKLERMIKSNLAHVHKVLDGEAEREAVIDEELHQRALEMEKLEQEKEAEETKIEPVKKEVTVLVVKPDAVKAGKVEEIISKVEELGYEVLAKEERVLTKEEAAEFYKQHEGTDKFESLIEFMASGPCMTLVLTRGSSGEGVVEDIRKLLGPKDIEQAKEEVPDSLRAQYGTSTLQNALHASDSSEMAARELAFFYPKLDVPWVPGTEPPLQRTVALIRPDALREHKDAILARIQEAGFQVAKSKELTLTKEHAAMFYQDHKEKEYFDSLCTSMSNGPMLALCLAREDAVSRWRGVLGPAELEKAKQEAPESLRAQYAVEGVEVNQLHGASSEDEVRKDMEFFFPEEKTLAVIKPNAMSHKEAIIDKIKQCGFSVTLSKEQQLTKEMAEQLYAEHQGKEFFNELTEFMTSGPSSFMVLSSEDAVSGWRALMGPANPEEAKINAPDSIRAMFGEDILKNAVHGSSDPDRARRSITALFGEDALDEATLDEAKVSNPATDATSSDPTDTNN